MQHWNAPFAMINDTSGCCHLACSCGHDFCRSCIKSWVDSCEAAKTAKPPPRATCPTCRRPVNDWDLVRLVGHSFRPPRPCIPATDEEDALFLSYLAEQGARSCPQCNMWILRSDGYDNIMVCLCGTSFCYDCGKDHCSCGEAYDVDCDYSFNDAIDYYELELNDDMDDHFLMEGVKNSAGGKASLRWKGNSRTQHKPQPERKKGKHGYHRSAKKLSQRATIRSAMD